MSYTRLDSALKKEAPKKPLAKNETKPPVETENKETVLALKIIRRNALNFDKFATEIEYKKAQYPRIVEAIQKDASLQKIRGALDPHEYDLLHFFLQDKTIEQHEKVRKIKEELLREKLMQIERSSLKNQLLESIKKNVNKFKHFDELVTEVEYKKVQYPKVNEAAKRGASLEELRDALGSCNFNLIEQFVSDTTNEDDENIRKVKEEFYNQKKALEDKIAEENRQIEYKTCLEAIVKIGKAQLAGIASFGMKVVFDEKEHKELSENYIPRFLKANGKLEDLYGIIPFGILCELKYGKKNLEEVFQAANPPMKNILGL